MDPHPGDKEQRVHRCRISPLVMAVLVSACSLYSEVPLRESLLLPGNEWVEVSMASPKKREFPHRALRFHLKDAATAVNPAPIVSGERQRVVRLENEKKVVLRAVAVGSDGSTYPLVSNSHACMKVDGKPGSCELDFSGDLPRDFVLSAVKIMASDAIEITQVKWMEFSSK